MELNEAIERLKKAGLIAEETTEDALARMAANSYEGQVDEIVEEIELVKPVKNYYEVDPDEDYVKAQFEIVMQDDTVWEVQFRKGHGFNWRGNVYPWRIIKNNNGGFTQVAFSLSQLHAYMKKVKAIQSESVDEALETLKNAGLIVEGSMSLDDKIANAKQFNAGIDEMKKDAVNIFKQAFYEDEVTDNGDGTYTVVPDRDYDIQAIYTWDDNDTLTCTFNYTNNALTFKHLSRHLNYDPKGGPWQEGKWSGDEALENFLTDLAFEFQNAVSC